MLDVILDYVFGLSHQYSDWTLRLFVAAIYGGIVVIVSGLIFEQGRRYVKVGKSNEFSGKIETLPFLLIVLILGDVVQWGHSYVEPYVIMIHPLSRIGLLLIALMLLLNWIVENFRYDDEKSLVIYGFGLLTTVLPYL